MLFTQFERFDQEPKKLGESFFDFLQRSGRKGMQRIRDFLEEMVDHYPETERNDIVGRICSDMDFHFRSSVFELVLYSALMRMGATVEPHPDLGNGRSSRPDFRVAFKSGAVIYLEAVSASENSGLTLAGQRRANSVLEALKSKPHHSFSVAIQVYGEPSIQPSSRSLIRDVHAWLDSLDPVNNNRDAEWVYQKDGWHLGFKAIPMPSECRGRVCSLFLSRGSVRTVNRSKSIKNAILEKANKYRPLSAPLVVAVNSDSFDLSRFEVMNALYGDLAYCFDQDRPNIEPWNLRLRNGAWNGAKGPQYCDVVGAWIFKDLHAHSFSTCAHRLYVNPYAEATIPIELQKLPKAVAVDKEMYFSEGTELKSLLQLGSEWPSAIG
jgi:hypothetical protein